MREVIEAAFRALDERGDVAPFRELFAENAQWLGVAPERGPTPI
jgi:hypothetical protein